MPSHAGKGGGVDTAVQTAAGPLTAATTGASFNGPGSIGYAPSDSNIAVGPNYIFAVVNSVYQIFNKQGASVLGPKSLSSLWTGVGGGCSTANAGDVVVQYDKLVNRWVLTQLSSLSSPYGECIAVSTTGDPTGTYATYYYTFNSNLPDYPKFGVWPTPSNSAYLATYNLFKNGSSFAGAELCAYDRNAMLSAAVSPTQICYTINDASYLPSDLDGSTTPPDGTPGYFLTYETLSSLRIWKLAPNFANPGASTLTQATDLSVTPFSELCSGGTCVPQGGTNNQLDSLGDRPMYRLAYRNYGDHQSMVFNNSATGGPRWYELRASSGSQGFSVYQQGTYSPDGTFRWMGSAAMDQSGDLAIGYSASNSTIHPAVRYAGRAPVDPLNTLGTESSIIEGTGSQTNGLHRWGDYTSLRIDPVDDCTFWYINQYLQADGAYNWSTRIGSFKFASCSGATPDFSLSASPTAITVPQGAGGSSTITVTSLAGYNSPVSLTVSGCPSFTTCALNPTSVTPPANGSGTSMLSVTTNAGGTTPAGTYTLTISGNGTVHTTSVSLTITTQSTGTTPPTQGLVGYWSFDEGSGTIAHDTSGSGYNGTISGATWIAGKINSALSFNGNASQVVTSNISLANTFSVAAWVNPAASTQGSWVRIAETAFNAGFYLGVNENGSKYKFIVNGGSGSSGACGASFGCIEGGTITAGWHLLVATFDGTVGRLYVDNTLTASDTETAPSNTNLPLYIGQYFGGPGYGWKGGIDEVRLYTRALSAADISTIYNYTGSSDTTAPSIPTGVSALAVSSSQINVSWTASMDNVGVAGYKVYRNNALIGTATGVTYSDQGLAASTTYSYTVQAYDAAGNTSASSSPASATTLSSGTQPPTQGLIGYWNFDEGSGTIAHDTSGSGYNGTVSGAVWVAGKINSALNFSGTGSQVVTSAIPLGGSFSISAWVNPAVMAPGSYVRIAETQFNAGFYLGADQSGTRYKFIVNGGSGSSGSCGALFGCVEGGAFSTGWHLATGTFDGATARLYVDGTLVASDTATAPSTISVPLYIGQYYGGPGYGWNGIVDEVRLYNRALNATEISNIYHQ